MSEQRPPVLVTTDWVAEHLGDPQVVLLEVDRDLSAYHWLHLPGAVGFDWIEGFADLLGPEPDGSQAFADLMSRLGISPGTTVVLYGDADNLFAASTLWLLRYHGHQRLHLMNGGRAAWLAEGRPVTGEETVRPAVDYPLRAPDPTVRATRDDLLAHLAGHVPDGLVVDCRSREEYFGEVVGSGAALPRDGRTATLGHVPGAVNLPPGTFVDDQGALLPPEELARRAAEHGVTPDRSVTAYCQLSERSSLTWVALHEVLGFPHVRVYDGGWWEYSHLIGVPVQQDVGQTGETVRAGSEPTGERTVVDGG